MIYMFPAVMWVALNHIREIKTPLGSFEDLFTLRSLESLEHIVAGLIVSDRKTVRGLHSRLVGEDKKSRAAYEWFFTTAKWDEDELAQRKAELFYRLMDIKQGDKLLLIVDDTLNEKKGKATEGVGYFKDHSTGKYVWGNCFVTSALQCKGVFVPHKARMYLKEEDARRLGYEFKAKPEIAFEEVVEPLKVPEGIVLYVVFDSWWYGQDFICKILSPDRHVVCQLKVNKNLILNGRKTKPRYLRGDYEEVEVRVRGKEKRYMAFEKILEIEGIGRVKVVVSKSKNGRGRRNYYMSTDTGLSVRDVLEVYENRWNIETTHRESNQKLGFKEYHMRRKPYIERFMQIVFLVWMIILFIELKDSAGSREYEGWVKSLRLGEVIDQLTASSILGLLISSMMAMGYPPPSEDFARYFRGLLIETKGR